MSKFAFLLSSVALGSFLAACSAAPVATNQPPAKVGKTFPNAADAPVFAGTNFKAMQIFDLEAGLYLDEAALLEALDSGRVAGAALDVLASEPPAKEHPLLAHPRVIVTPHAAWSTVEAEARLRRMAAAEVARVLAGDQPLSIVNPTA